MGRGDAARVATTRAASTLARIDHRQSIRTPAPRCRHPRHAEIDMKRRTHLMLACTPALSAAPVLSWAQAVQLQDCGPPARLPSTRTSARRAAKPWAPCVALEMKPGTRESLQTCSAFQRVPVCPGRMRKKTKTNSSACWKVKSTPGLTVIGTVWSLVSSRRSRLAQGFQTASSTSRPSRCSAGRRRGAQARQPNLLPDQPIPAAGNGPRAAAAAQRRARGRPNYLFSPSAFIAACTAGRAAIRSRKASRLG